jgi:hypothetical protein
VTLSRRWKIVLVAVAAIWLALGILSLVLFNIGDTVPGQGEGDPITGLTTP